MGGLPVEKLAARDMASRFRGWRVRLFQGPCKALPLEDTTTLCRVVDYIRPNAVRANAVGPGHS
jgi:hypothetical protein